MHKKRIGRGIERDIAFSPNTQHQKHIPAPQNPFLVTCGKLVIKSRDPGSAPKWQPSFDSCDT